jgi:hypothetical protein
MNTHQAFARMDYEFSDSVHGYVEGSLTENRTQNFGAYNALLNGVTLSATNPFLAQTYQNQLAAANATTFNVSRVFRRRAAHQHRRQERPVLLQRRPERRAWRRLEMECLRHRCAGQARHAQRQQLEQSAAGRGPRRGRQSRPPARSSAGLP